MRRKILVVGFGGQAREAIDVLEALGLAGRIAGYTVHRRHVARQMPVLLGKWKFFRSIEDLVSDRNGFCLVPSVFDPDLRKKIVADLQKKGLETSLTLVHPKASVSRFAIVGEGVFINANVTLTGNPRVGDYVVINPNCSIHHDVIVGDYVSIAAGAMLNGYARVGNLAYIGSGAIIRNKNGRGQPTRVGRRVVVGMGAVVTKSLPDQVVAYGNPARVILRGKESRLSG